MNTEIIEKIETTIVDLPLKRIHKFSATTINCKSFVIVQIFTKNGIAGIGEATTPGGPWWAGEAVETIKVMIDSYLAPVLIGENALEVDALLQKMDAVAANNTFAKAALEIALFDIKGQALDVPVYKLFGGLARASMPLKWPLAQGDAKADLKEAETLMSSNTAQEFKVKMGYMTPQDDVDYIRALCQGLNNKATLCGDLNATWDELTTQKNLPALAEHGLDMLEQPIAAGDYEALARIREASAMPILADESVFSARDVNDIHKYNSADMLSLKIFKHGGLTRTNQIAQLAAAKGIACYAGTFLESSIGTAAFMQLLAAQDSIDGGNELVGPIWLADDIVEESVEYKDNHIWVKHSPGLGVTLDQDKLSHYQRV
ncbi:MAG: muconate/chloromuconate family cycloisomerase [Gammaproteobacteria bacterium]|jgi:muconate cycloisomerase|nr:muconate/chloromuconate family cycloisomerase [Gammaproteobacteria bacterium]